MSFVGLWFPRSPVPAAPPAAVERDKGGSGAPNAALTAAPLPPASGRPDPFGADQHQGSADLEEYPPSSAELTYASALYHDPTDVEAARHLLSASVSVLRVAAVQRHVRRLARAQGILRRIDARQSL